MTKPVLINEKAAELLIKQADDIEKACRNMSVDEGFEYVTGLINKATLAIAVYRDERKQHHFHIIKECVGGDALEAIGIPCGNLEDAIAIAKLFGDGGGSGPLQ